MENILLITMQYPPSSSSSGYLRAFKFTKYLPEFGWNPIVLSIHTRVYDSIDPQTISKIPADLEVYRPFSFHSAKDFSFRGKYLKLLATPDVYASWIFFGALKALSIIKKHNVKAIMSTYPPESANMLGLVISKITGIPWICDLRDPIFNENFPTKRTILEKKIKLWMEKKTVKNAKMMVFTTELMKKYYLCRFNKLDPSKCHVIYNGYDEDDFLSMDRPQKNSDVIRMVHTGILDMTYRNPKPFLKAIAESVRKNSTKKNIEIELLGAGGGFEGKTFHQWLSKNALDGIVTVSKRAPYKEALQKQADADVLLLFQNHSAINMQVPAKLFEYMRIGKTVLAIAPETSETAKIIKESKCGYLIDSENGDAFQGALEKFIQLETLGYSVKNKNIQHYSRKYQSQNLAYLLSSNLE